MFLSTKRASSRRGLLGLIFLTIVCITTILAGALSYTQLAATNALRQSIPASSGEEAFYRLHSTLPSEEAERQAQATAFEDLFEDAGVTGATNIHSSVYAQPVDHLPSSTAKADVPEESEFGLTSWTQAPEHVTVVDGEWPAMDASGTTTTAATGGQVQAAVDAGTAKHLGLAAGQSLTLQTSPDVEIVIVAVFEPDREAELVLDAVAKDYEKQQVYPVVVPSAAVQAASSSPKISWTILPDAERLTASDLPTLITGLESLEDRAVAGEATNVSGVVGTGAVAASLQTALSATQAVRGVVPVAMILLVLLSIVAVIQLARLLAGTRSAETTLLGARGFSGAQHLRLGFTESWPVVLGGTALGYGLAITVTPLITSVLSGGAAGWATGFAETLATTWAVPLAIVVAATVVMTGTVFLEGMRSAAALKMRDAGRRLTVASFGVLVLVLGAAAFTLWQFHQFDSPMAPDATGNLVVNPAAVPAPALAIVAFSALALVAIAAVTAVVQRVAAGNRGIGFPLAARQVSRRISSFLVPIALITVTVGAGTLAAGYTQTASAAKDAAAQLINGSDVRLSFDRPTVIADSDDIVDLEPYAATAGTTMVSPVITQEIKIGDADVELTAVDPQALSGLLAGTEDVTDADALAAALRGGQPGTGDAVVPLPKTTKQLNLQISSAGEDVLANRDLPAKPAPPERRVTLTAWFETARGRLVPVDLGAINLNRDAGEETHQVSADLPEGLELRSLRAIDFTAFPTTSSLQYTVKVDGITALDAAGAATEVQVDDGRQFQLRRGVFPGRANAGIPPDGSGFVLGSFSLDMAIQGRLMPALPAGAAAETTIPVVVTAAVLEDLDMAVGDELTLQPAGTEVPARVAAVVPTLPGVATNRGVMVDITAFQSAALGFANTIPEVAELWFASNNPQQTAEELRATAAPDTEITTADTGFVQLFLAPAVHSLWIGTVGALVVGAIALAASIQTLALARRPEVSILSALGMSGKLQARGRRLELLTVGLLSIGMGLAAGWLTSLLTVQALARSTVINAPATMPVPLGISWPQWAAILLAQLLLLLAASWFYGSTVRRQSRSAEAGGLR